MSSTDVAKTEPNGAQDVAHPMRESRQRKVQEGITAHYEAEEEIAQLKESLRATRLDLQTRDMELASLRERMDAMKEDHATVLNAAESRATAAQAERDTAVADATALKAFIASMKAIWDRIPKNGAT